MSHRAVPRPPNSGGVANGGMVASTSTSASSTAASSNSKRPASSKGSHPRDEDPGQALPKQKKPRTEKRQQSESTREPRRLPAANTSEPTSASFQPRPAHSADEPQDVPEHIPPPPSTRRIARHRHGHQAPAPVATPAPARAAKSLKYHSGDESDDDASGTRALSVFTPAPKAVKHLLFKAPTRPRPSAAPPPSPGPAAAPAKKDSRRARKSRLNEDAFDSMIPLPVTDTPVINKNRELRKDAERRSSLGMRGQRASSSFGRGDPSYPHSGVPYTSFYKHLPVDQPEPIKARWLISWCAKRALDEHIASSKSKKKAGASDEIDKLLADVMDDFVANVAKGNVDTNVFGAASASSSAISVRPHPRNVDNRATLEKEEAIIKRMRAEDRDWNRIAHKTNDLQALTLEATSGLRDSRPPPDMQDASTYFKQLLKLSDDALEVWSGDIGAAGDFGEVEFEVDLLHQTSHQANQYMHQAQRFLDGIFSSLAADLLPRDDGDALPAADDAEGPDTAALLTSAAAGPSRPRSDPMSMLRALAAADSKQQSAEAVAKAAAISVAPSASSVRAQAATPRRAATTATPRRQSVYGRGVGTPGRR